MIDLGKILIFLERVKSKIIKVDGSLKFQAYPFNGNPPTDRQWVIIDLKELGRPVYIKFYVSVMQIRFQINGVELNQDLIQPYKTEIESLNIFFKKEWERRELNNVREQFE